MTLIIKIDLRSEFVAFIGSEDKAKAYILNEMKELLQNNLNKPMIIESWKVSVE